MFFSCRRVFCSFRQIFESIFPSIFRRKLSSTNQCQRVRKSTETCKCIQLFSVRVEK